MPEIVVETVLRANFPDQLVFNRIGLGVIRGACADQLKAEGCQPESIAFGEAWYDEEMGAWLIRGTGTKED